MSTPAQIGKNEYKAALTKAHNAKSELRLILKRVMQETPTNLIRALVGQAALELGELDEALFRLEEIGRNSE